MTDYWYMLAYHNQHEFKKDAYSENSISKESVITRTRTIYEKSQMTAWYTDFFVDYNLLTDEVDLL